MEVATRLSGADRRRHQRYAVSAAVTLLCDMRAMWCTNMSVGGALLRGPGHIGDPIDLSLQLHLPWYQPIAIGSRIVHSETTRNDLKSYGVKFLHLSASNRLALRQILTASEEACQRQESTILAITDRPLTRSSLEQDFYLLGASAVIVTDVVEAMGWLQDWIARVDTLVADLNMASDDVFSFLAFLAQHFPSIRRVGIVDRGASLRPSAPERDLVHDLLDNPWITRRLERALDW